jgi:hypothetical protein
MMAVVTCPTRPEAASVDELLEGAVRHGSYRPADFRSSALFERVEIDGAPCVVKYVHPDHDFAMRVTGDVGCLPRRVWRAGLMDLVPERIDHGQLGVAPWGRNGWGAAILMRDLTVDLVPASDVPVSVDEHLGFLDACAALAAASWGWIDDEQALLAHELRWTMFGSSQLAGEEHLGFPEMVPRLAVDGWQRFAAKVGDADVYDAVDGLRHDPRPLSRALLTTPQCFLHGDWKFGNLGTASDGRVVLIDWTYPGAGPIAHEVAWYLALNRSRLPVGHSKETTIADFRRALERQGIDTEPWWPRQLDLCLLGALVQFGWEKALGDGEDAEAELRWWVAAARRGLPLL